MNCVGASLSRAESNVFYLGSRVRRLQPSRNANVYVSPCHLVLDPDRRYIAPAGRTAVGGRLYELVEVGHFVIRSRYVVSKGYKAARTFRLSLIVYVFVARHGI